MRLKGRVNHAAVRWLYHPTPPSTIAQTTHTKANKKKMSAGIISAFRVASYATKFSPDFPMLIRSFPDEGHLGLDCDSGEQGYLPERTIATTFPPIAAGRLVSLELLDVSEQVKAPQFIEFALSAGD
jgi:hypothetical protein